MDNRRKKEDLMYAEMETTSNLYKGKIIYKGMSKGYVGTTLFHLSDGQKVSISSLTRNYEFCNCDIESFLHIGDSIYKPRSSDSIYVYRGDRIYYFILGQEINNDKK
ncbi:hypothetical protein [Prevotella sp. 10(H)]|uniref:hypothetical protein n=1 Tax=Prevotella sp. 10(H) TaxID=1158294 RepID=UPI0012DFB3C1|nr:hypothetical protein [Prevotella sp. 10(H)]